MMRSLYSGVSGLRTHQTRMDVIGNNIANVNTTAFKAKQMNFSDMLYQTTQAATGANAANGTGGTNPRQIGLGVKGAAINTTITTEGANQSTGNPFDLKITGEAFFVVSDGTNTFYTRDGSFDVDDAGNLCMASTGYIVQGWGVDQNGNIVQGNVGSISVTSLDTFGAAATTEARISGIIDANDSELENTKTGGKQVTVDVYDKAGYPYNLKFGILPVTTDIPSTKKIDNNETEYNLETIHKVDTSKLTYSYTVGTETRYLSNSLNPEIMDAMEQQIWKEVSGASAPAYVTEDADHTYELGKENCSVIFDLKQFLDDNYADKVLEFGGLLNDMQSLTVTFSGETGFVREKDFKGYPLSSELNPLKVDEEAVKKLYTTQDNVTYTAASTSVTSIRQNYVDDNQNSQTDYIFRVKSQTGTGTDDLDVKKDLQSEVARLLQNLGNPTGKTNSYVTQEDKSLSSPEKGRYRISLLGMTDSNQDDVDISRLLNNGTTTWDIVYDKSSGEFSYVGQEGNKAFTVNLSAVNDNGNFDNVSIDISDTTDGNNDKKCSVTGKKLDGRRIGTRSGVTIGTDGIVTALYSNGMSRKLGQICVATFPNAMGLENAGDNLYQVTASSGDVSIVDIKASGTGSLTTGILEMSNVDLSQQFTDMITTQRGFQANSRIITTSDTLLEELINLKR